MKSYKFDTHVHTSETSPCGKVSGAELVHLYKEAGYAGVIITDHYYDQYFEDLPCPSWEEKVDMYLAGYKKASIEGERIGLSVILGMELTFSGTLDDFLIYGIDEEFLKENKELYKLDLESFRKLIKGKDFLTYQAHPFRSYINLANPLLLDGVEVYNGNPRHDSQNHLAYEFATKNSLRMSSGSDFHQVGDLARGGIILPEDITSPRELAHILKSDKVIDIIRA